MRNSKRAMEMSIGMIVLLIISILIFGLSLQLLFKWFGSAQQLQASIDKQTQDQIISALKSGNQLVAIPFSIQQAKRGDAVNFGVGVRNILADSPFSIAVSFANAYAPDGSPIDKDPAYIEKNWLGNFNTVPTFTLKRNEQDVKTIQLKADLDVAQNKATPKGDYVFNVCVYNKALRSDGLPQTPCDASQFKNDPSQFYTQKIYQITVRVI